MQVGDQYPLALAIGLKPVIRPPRLLGTLVQPRLTPLRFATRSKVHAFPYDSHERHANSPFGATVKLGEHWNKVKVENQLLFTPKLEDFPRRTLSIERTLTPLE